MRKQFTMNFSSDDIEKLKRLTGATTMNGAVDIAIQYTLDSYRKDIDFDLQQFLEKLVSERMQHYTDDIKEKMQHILNEFENLYRSEGKIIDAIDELKEVKQSKW